MRRAVGSIIVVGGLLLGGVALVVRPGPEVVAVSAAVPGVAAATAVPWSRFETEDGPSVLVLTDGAVFSAGAPVRAPYPVGSVVLVSSAPGVAAAELGRLTHTLVDQGVEEVWLQVVAPAVVPWRAAGHGPLDLQAQVVLHPTAPHQVGLMGDAAVRWVALADVPEVAAGLDARVACSHVVVQPDRQVGDLARLAAALDDVGAPLVWVSGPEPRTPRGRPVPATAEVPAEGVVLAVPITRGGGAARCGHAAAPSEVASR